jgi:hypothetical protein
MGLGLLCAIGAQPLIYPKKSADRNLQTSPLRETNSKNQQQKIKNWRLLSVQGEFARGRFCAFFLSRGHWDFFLGLLAHASGGAVGTKICPAPSVQWK